MNLQKQYEFFKPSNEPLHIIGCGSVGSTVAENLARVGESKFHLWDFDKVEDKNIANQMFLSEQVGLSKVDALSAIIKSINPDAEVFCHGDGWHGEPVSGVVFLCPDSVGVRRDFAAKNKYNPFLKLVLDFRTGLTDAQHYAFRPNRKEVESYVKTLDFTEEDARRDTPVSACGEVLGVATTVRLISALGVDNYINFRKGNNIRSFIQMDGFSFIVDAM